MQSYRVAHPPPLHLITTYYNPTCHCVLQNRNFAVQPKHTGKYLVSYSGSGHRFESISDVLRGNLISLGE